MTLLQTLISYKKVTCPHYYLYPYLPYTTGRNTHSHSLLKFKQGQQPDLDGWIDCGVEAIATVPLPSSTVIIRALHHNETIALTERPNSLDLLGIALAARIQTRYQPSLLLKHRTTRPIAALTREDRAAELHNIYYVGEAGDAPRSILILDDILTTGTTIKAILAALLPRFPFCAFNVFTLARAMYDAGDSALPIRGRTYQLEPGMNWILADPSGHG
jgi:predicted amidophosphoribosyltransferase